jgi:DNA-binding GntR family transcriptional regulator
VAISGMTRLKSELQGELVSRILGFLRSSPTPPQRIREAVLSRDLGVSRTPVRAALQHLVKQGVLKSHPQGGYVPGRTPPTTEAAAASSRATMSLYARILRDIILNDIPEAASGRFLERKYGAGRGELLQVLRRLVREGLAEPLPGRGWSFLRFDADQMSRSYHLRTILEPAVFLDQHFSVPGEILCRLKSEQQLALATLTPGSSWPELFELDASLHEALARGSGNTLVVDIIRRQNHYRRLAEFFSYSRIERIRASIAEHIEILDALMSGDQRWASELMRQHLKESQSQTEEHLQRDLEAVRRASSGIELL